MAIRIRLKLRAVREVEVRALVNSGFEANEPDIAIPLGVAEQLGLWPPSSGSLVEVVTASGGREAILIPRVIQVQSVDRPDKVTIVNALVIDDLDEVLISDYLAGELGIVLLDLRRGLWRFQDDPPSVIRQSV